MSKISFGDSFMDIIMKMSEGNPGAVTAIMDMIENGEKIDPQGAMGGLGSVLLLDTFGIYGTDIYVLWSDICGQELNKTLGVIRACQLGFFDPKTMVDACSRQDYSGRDMVPVEDLYQKVKGFLDQFDRVPA